MNTHRGQRQRPQREGITTPRVGILDGYEPPGMGLGTEFGSSARTVCTLTHKPPCQPLDPIFHPIVDWQVQPRLLLLGSTGQLSLQVECAPPGDSGPPLEVSSSCLRVTGSEPALQGIKEAHCPGYKRLYQGLLCPWADYGSVYS